MATKKKTTTPSTNAVAAGETVTVCFRSHIDRIFEIGDRKILIKGHNAKLRGVDGAVLDSGRAFGETVISKADWEAIKKTYTADKNEKLFSGGFIFAHENKVDARAEAKEKEDLKTGSEPIDTSNTITKKLEKDE